MTAKKDIDHMETWKKVCSPPKSMLKKIGGGRLKGMTDIKPQWRYMIATEVFGPCGFGWKFTIVNQWVEDVSDGQKIAFCDISFYYKLNGEWSEAIPSNGGSMLIANESKGPFSSDEAYKMALTDAISTAMGKIGVAADIYMGLWDGSKYTGTSGSRPAKSHIKNDDEPHYSKLVNDGLDHEQVTTTVINFFDGDKQSAHDWIIDAGFPIPSDCNAEELRGILDALKKYAKIKGEE